MSKKESVLTYKGYQASIEPSIEDNCLVGRVLHINDSLVFGADTIEGLQQEFRNAIDDYLEFCADVGKDPDKPYKGSFNVRMNPELHQQAAKQASLSGTTLNNFVVDAVRKAIDPSVDATTEIHNHINIHVKPSTQDVTFSSPRDSWAQVSPAANHGIH